MNIDSIVYLSQVSSIALDLPGADAAVTHGTPSFKVNKKLFARIKEDGKTLAVYTDNRDEWMKKNPLVFFITDHYLNYPMMLINLETVKKKDLQQLLFASWKKRAPKRLLQEYEKGI